jgi:hypothetical protein
MRTTERLTALKNWCYKNLCEGRMMKAPGENMDVTKIVRTEPKVFLAWAPNRMDKTGNLKEDTLSTCPGIIIMPSQSNAKYVEEKRFDRYNNVHRPQELGQHLAVSILFTVYEPGIRLPGFVDSADENGKGLDMTLIKEGTEEGLFTLMDWMDDCLEAMIRDQFIPDSDLFLEDETMQYSLYTDQSYVVDRRPIYYGFINASFQCYANHGVNEEMNNLL